MWVGFTHYTTGAGASPDPITIIRTIREFIDTSFPVDMDLMSIELEDMTMMGPTQIDLTLETTQIVLLSTDEGEAMKTLRDFIQGDTLKLQGTLAQNVEGWGFKAQMSDVNGANIQKASLQAGGDDTQIEVTVEASGTFVVRFCAGETSVLEPGDVTVEVEVTTNEGDVYTVYQAKALMIEHDITWDLPNS